MRDCCKGARVRLPCLLPSCPPVPYLRYLATSSMPTHHLGACLSTTWLHAPCLAARPPAFPPTCLHGRPLPHPGCMHTCLPVHVLPTPCCLAAQICRGVYPWEASTAAAAPASATVEQLVTKLRTHTCELLRAEEELALLATERTDCLAFLEQRKTAIDAALAQCQARATALRSDSDPVPACTSFGARQPAAGSEPERRQELLYSEGLELLLRDALHKAATQLQAARAAFGEAGGSSGSSGDAIGEYLCFDDEAEVM